MFLLTPDAISAWANLGLLITAVISAGFLLHQLRGLIQQISLANRANEFTNLAIVIQLEMMVANHRNAWDDASASCLKLQGLPPTDENKRQAEIHAHMLKIKSEQYLNALDRLCSCLRRGYLQEREYQEDYRLSINEAMERFPEKLGTSSRFRNIVKVHDAWKDGKSACESKIV